MNENEFLNLPAACDILIVGGGVGGVAAALAACEMGRRVVMTEPTAWIGGQLTQQAVPPDENHWIEHGCATRRYREYREDVRAFYRRHYPLTAEARRNDRLNPGNGTVSRLCHEFRVGLLVLEAGQHSRGQAFEGSALAFRYFRVKSDDPRKGSDAKPHLLSLICG